MATGTARILTTTNGDRYLVQQVDCSGPSNVYHCWGEVIGVKSCATTHGPSKSFQQDQVREILEITKTFDLCKALFQQNIEKLRQAGRVLSSPRSRKRPLITLTPGNRWAA